MVDGLLNRNLTIWVVQFGPLSHPNNNEEELIMKITRNFAGTSLEINLTEDECKKIYDEIQFKKDMAEVDDAIAVTCQYNDIPEDVIKELTQTFQMKKQKEDGTFALANRVVEENKILLEPYKKEEEYYSYEIECTQTKTHTFTVRAKTAEEASLLFEKWRGKHLCEFDSEMADSDVDDEEISEACKGEGDPDEAEIQ